MAKDRKQRSYGERALVRYKAETHLDSDLGPTLCIESEIERKNYFDRLCRETQRAIPYLDILKGFSLLFDFYSSFVRKMGDYPSKYSYSGFPIAKEISDNIDRLGRALKEQNSDAEAKLRGILNLEGRSEAIRQRVPEYLINNGEFSQKSIEPYLKRDLTVSDVIGWLRLSSSSRTIAHFKYLDPVFFDVDSPIFIFDNPNISYFGLKGHFTRSEHGFGIFKNFMYNNYSFKGRGDTKRQEIHAKIFIPLFDYMLGTKGEGGRIGFKREIEKLQNAVYVKEWALAMQDTLNRGMCVDPDRVKAIEKLAGEIRDYSDDDLVGRLAKAIVTYGNNNSEEGIVLGNVMHSL